MQMRYIKNGILFIAIALAALQETKLSAQQTLIDEKKNTGA